MTGIAAPNPGSLTGIARIAGVLDSRVRKPWTLKSGCGKPGMPDLPKGNSMRITKEQFDEIDRWLGTALREGGMSENAVRNVQAARLTLQASAAHTESEASIYAYEWDCSPGVVHRDFQYGTYNGRYPDRTLTLYAKSPAPSPVSGADEREAVEFYAMNPSAAVADLRKRIAPTGQQALSDATVSSSEKRCPACNGNDADCPCAYPEGGRAGCLRDDRLQKSAAAPQAVALTGALEQAIRRLKKNPDNGDEIFRCGFNGAIDVVLSLLAATLAPATADARDAKPMTQEELDALPDWVKNARPPEAS